jgi:HlyD family type I secretion membrane fusion protein
MTARPDPAAEPVPVALKPLALATVIVAAAFFGALFIWGALAQLDAGAIAAGEVIPSGRVRTVQHLEGGIIAAIEVREGDSVKEGQPLLRLQPTEARAQVAINETERVAQEALHARLVAERDGIAQGGFRRTGVAGVDNQVRLFEQRRASLAREVAGIRARIAQAKSEMTAWQQRGESIVKSLDMQAEQTRMNQKLYEQNYIARPRLLDLQTREAEVSATLQETRAEQQRALTRITDGELALDKLRADWMSVVLDDLRKAQDALAQANERVAVARDRLARTEVRAPQDGRVQQLRYTTVGGVVPPNGAIMDIVPLRDDLVVEARIAPDDIDVVTPGLASRVRLTAYRPRTHIALRGTVTQVSADAVRDDKPGGGVWYTVRVKIDDDPQLKKYQMVLVPGMLAQVEIVTGTRSVLRYLTDPLRVSMQRAFWED